MAKQIRYGTYADFQPEKMVTAELACVISGDPAVSDGRSLYICFSPGVVKRIATYADFEREIQNATQEIQDAFTEDVQAAIQAAVNAINNANDAITQANEAAEQALSAAADAEEAAEAALAAAGGDISEKTVTFESQDAEDPEEWTDVDVLSTGTKLSLLFQKVSSMFKNIRFLKKKTDELDLGVNELNTNMESSGINDERLSSFSIGSTLSVEELLGRPTVTFFTNWLDTVNFPEIYGSGILIPGLDVSNKFLIYISSNSIIYAGFARTTAGGISWKRVQLE